MGNFASYFHVLPVTCFCFCLCFCTLTRQPAIIGDPINPHGTTNASAA